MATLGDSRPRAGAGRLLALDPGQRRVGIALSDETRTIAQPLCTLRRTGAQRDLAEISEIARRWGVTDVVVGLPLQMNGEEGAEASRARGFGEALGRTSGLPVRFVDERLTSREAERHLLASDRSRTERRQLSDQLAATLILQFALASERPR